MAQGLVMDEIDAIKAIANSGSVGVGGGISALGAIMYFVVRKMLSSDRLDRTANDAHTNIIKDLSTEYAGLLDKVTALQQSVGDLRQDIAEKSAKISILANENDLLKEKIVMLESENSRLTELMLIKDDEIKHLRLIQESK